MGKCGFGVQTMSITLVHCSKCTNVYNCNPPDAKPWENVFIQFSTFFKSTDAKNNFLECIHLKMMLWLTLFNTWIPIFLSRDKYRGRNWHFTIFDNLKASNLQLPWTWAFIFTGCCCDIVLGILWTSTCIWSLMLVFQFIINFIVLIVFIIFYL